MENAFREKGTMEILQSSQVVLSDPQFNELLMKRITAERNRKIKIRFWINYSLIAISIGLIIFLVGRIFVIDPPIIIKNHNQAIGGPGGSLIADYGYFVLPLVILILAKKLFDARLRWR